MFWTNKLEVLILDGETDVFFQGLSRKESVLVAVKNIWNEKFNRNDQVTFERLEFVLDPNGNPEQEPPHIITRQMGLDDIEMRQTGFKNFKKLIK